MYRPLDEGNESGVVTWYVGHSLEMVDAVYRSGDSFLLRAVHQILNLTVSVFGHGYHKVRVCVIL